MAILWLILGIFAGFSKTKVTVIFSNFEAIQSKTILIFYEFCRRFFNYEKYHHLN